MEELAQTVLPQHLLVHVQLAGPARLVQTQQLPATRTRVKMAVLVPFRELHMHAHVPVASPELHVNQALYAQQLVSFQTQPTATNIFHVL